MVKREVLDQMRGYDEKLAYEDFDFWIRSSRNFKYCFTDQVLVAKRELPESLSAWQYTIKSDQMQSTFEVCKKAFQLNRNSWEREALNFRIMYEIRQCLRTKNYDLGLEFNSLLMKNKGYFASILYKLLLLMKIRIWYWFAKLFKFGKPERELESNVVIKECFQTFFLPLKQIVVYIESPFCLWYSSMDLITFIFTSSQLNGFFILGKDGFFSASSKKVRDLITWKTLYWLYFLL